MERIRIFFIIILGFFLWSCGSAERPVSLPIPFAGSYTGDTTVVVSNGFPVGGNPVGSLSIKNQSVGDTSTLVWKNFDAGTGAEQGSTTFFLDTLTDPVITNISSGIKRNYFLTASFDLGNGTQVTSDNLECFEYPSLFEPTFDINDVTVPSTCEQPQAVFRKAACSGNISEGVGDFTLGELVDARFGLGMVACANGDFLFHTQEKSAVYVHGVGPNSGSGTPADEILLTIITQGFATHVSESPMRLSNPIFLTGNANPVGTETDTVLDQFNVTPDRFDALLDVQLCIGDGDSNCLIGRQIHLLHDAIPELVEVVSEKVRTDFVDDPAFNEAIFQDNQQMVFYPASDGTDQDLTPLNCTEQTGMFKDLCDNFGPLQLGYRCFILVNPVSFQIVTIEGSWIISRKL